VLTLNNNFNQLSSRSIHFSQMLTHIISLARPYQYTKNLFIFLPAFFAFKLNQPEVVWRSFLAFCAFCLAASAVYICNDWCDRFEDREHPEKKYRPIASGKISTKVALYLFCGFFAAGITIASCMALNVAGLVLFYVIMNILYSIKLKHIPIIDIVIISIGFVIRLFVGAESTGVNLVNWIIVMTFLLALFLALAKRRDDALIFEKTNNAVRKVTRGYNLQFLDASMTMTGAVVILAYIMWSISPEITSKHHSDYIYLTSIFVILGVLRYMQITFVEQKSGSPSRILLKDTSIKLILTAWIISFGFIIY